MKRLDYGAGPIGRRLATLIGQAGKDVTLDALLSHVVNAPQLNTLQEAS
jgi:hypothetical protein